MPVAEGAMGRAAGTERCAPARGERAGRAIVGIISGPLATMVLADRGGASGA
jgi:hypothetical protein